MQLTLVVNLADNWCFLHYLKVWWMGGATCIAALPGLLYRHDQLVLSQCWRRNHYLHVEEAALIFSFGRKEKSSAEAFYITIFKGLLWLLWLLGLSLSLYFGWSGHVSPSLWSNVLCPCLCLSIIYRKQACKPRSYASLKLIPTHRLTSVKSSKVNIC